MKVASDRGEKAVAGGGEGVAAARESSGGSWRDTRE